MGTKEINSVKWYNEKANRDIQDAMKILTRAMMEDPDYAWGWHCNIACLLLDKGIDHKAANNRASGFMKLAFDVDTNRK
jgi:hypothetical protein